MTRRLSITLCLCALGLIFSSSAQASGGTVSAWGYNFYGQTATGQVTKTGCACLETPVPVPALAGVTQVAGGYDNSLYLLSDGTVKSAGYGYEGQLGYPVASPYESPSPTTIPGVSGAIAIAATGDNGYALLANGTLLAWGDNEAGQLGIGSSTGPEECHSDPCVTHPVPVPGLANVVAIAGGGEVVFALLADGTVMGWGEDEYGQLGDGTGVQGGCECVDHPIVIPGISGAITIAGGESWGAALLADHSLMAWGENYDGQLGNGTTEYNNTDCYCRGPAKTLTGVKAIDAGDYTGAAIMLDGSVKTWGWNRSGQLGIGETTPSGCECVPTPTTIPAFAGAQAVDASYYDTLALLGDGTMRGAGYNTYGELGDGTTELRAAPVSNSIAGASAVAANTDTSAAIIGPSQTLSVAFAGAGTGTVQGGGEIICPTICAAKYPQGKVVNLTATSTNGGFAGFTGPCTGAATCQAKMEADQTVTATFGVPVGTKITKAKILSPKKKATFSFSAPGAITGYQCKLNRPKPKPKKKAKTSKQQKKPKFANCKSAKIYKNLKPGKYTFQVRALDVLGADAKPAKRVFNIHPPKKHEKH